MTWNQLIETAKANKTIIVKRSLIAAGTAAGIVLTAVLASRATVDMVMDENNLDAIVPADEPVIDNDDN